MEYIFFIGSEETKVVMIGTSARPLERLEGVQREFPTKVYLLGSVPANQCDLAELHRRFAQHHMRGKWFAYVPAIKKFIAGLAPVNFRKRKFPPVKCKQCGAGWTPRRKNPVQCPRCKRVDWKGSQVDG